MFSLFKKLSDNPIELYQNIENGKRAKASFEKLEELANGGNAVASYFLALCYACGQVVNEDRNMFVKYLLKSAEGNYPIALARLGDCYYNGEDLEQNYKKGIEYYEKAIEKSYGMDREFISDLHFDLFHCYYDDNKIEKDLDKAFYHLKEASEHNLEALFELAQWYFNGNNIEQNYREAFKCYHSLAEYDETGESAYYLALSHEKGYGTEANIDDAKFWYRKAAVYGYEKAIKRLEELSN